MSSSLNRIKKNIIEAMQSANSQGTSACDSVAEVRRVEGDTALVHIAGGVDDTPVKLTIAAKAGDTVQVRVGGAERGSQATQTTEPVAIPEALQEWLPVEPGGTVTFKNADESKQLPVPNAVSWVRKLNEVE